MKNSLAKPSKEWTVNSHTEWDPLEEVIVGILDGASVLPMEPPFEAVVHPAEKARAKEYFSKMGGTPVPDEVRNAAQKELDELVHILKSEGVVVRRPDPINHAVEFSTPLWKSPGGNCQANPRDVLIVFGDEILEATMAWHSRYFEYLAYRTLCKEYFRNGARWSAAPKPQLTEQAYNENYVVGSEYILTEFEPIFDAADMTRCGVDIFFQKSHTSNQMGIDWVARHLGDKYRVHTIEFNDARAMHIDATFVPLAPGKVLVNPDRPIKKLPDIFKKAGWDLLEAPRTTLASDSRYFEAFRWLGMNMLSIDEKRVIVEKNELPMIKALKEWGFEPIPCPFRANYIYGGSFHCATVDIRRRGQLQSYF